MKYSIVIPTYNHCNDLLKPCIDSILKYTDMSDVELIISANGCTDNTKSYLDELSSQFNKLGFGANLKVLWNEQPLGYPRAVNAGIKLASAQYVVLLNNDTILLDQSKNKWLYMMEDSFRYLDNCGVSGPLKSFSPEANSNFVIFFCAMIDRKVFNSIGLLNEEYDTGSGEDIEFCVEAMQSGYQVSECASKFLSSSGVFSGEFPIYHKGQGTMRDESLVSDWDGKFKNNLLKLAHKYNPEYYKRMLMNNFERYLAIKKEPVHPREQNRYKWAASKLLGNTVLEIGCSNGYGTQFFPSDIDYTGLDYDAQIIEAAKGEDWGANTKFFHADINAFELGQYDTIVAMEVIEHLDNGLEIVEKLKKHCKRLLITVPYKEPIGFWGEHHRLHMLDESHLPGFTYQYMSEFGDISDTPHDGLNLMMCQYDAS